MTLPRLRVVFDINVFVDALVGKDSTFPLIVEIPPTTSNHSADALSLAYDAENFSLFISPHILKNAGRLMANLGLSEKTVQAALQAFADVTHFSGGSVVDPERTVFEISDFEDNLILDLVKAIDAQILVTSDWDLLQHNPWNGRLIMTPAAFVQYLMRMKARY